MISGGVSLTPGTAGTGEQCPEVPLDHSLASIVVKHVVKHVVKPQSKPLPTGHYMSLLLDFGKIAECTMVYSV